MNRILLSLLAISLQICQPAFASTYIKGPRLVEGVESTATSGGTKTLTKDSETVQIFTGTMAHTLELPDATTLPVGAYFEVFNYSSDEVCVESPSLLLGCFATLEHTKVLLRDNSTSGGTWVFDRSSAFSLDSAYLVGALPVNKIEAQTANKALVSDASGYLSPSSTTSTEIGYLSGVTSSVQTQLDSKASKTLTNGHIYVGNASNVATDVAVSGDIAITNAGVTSYSGTVPINKGGTGATTATAAFDALAPSQGSNSGKFLTTNGTTTSWGTAALTAQGQSEGSGVTTTTIKAPYNQFTTTGTDERLIETGNGNLLLNPSFEHSTATTSWTQGSGTSCAAETTEVKHGAKSLLCTLTAVNGVSLSQDVTPTIKMSGSNFEYGVWLKTAASTLQVCARNAAATVGVCIPVIGSNTWGYFPAYYPGPSSGSVGVSVITTSSTTSSFYADSGYVGENRNIGTVAQAYFFGGMEQAGASGCSYAETTSTGINDFKDLGTGSGCNAWTTSGSVTATSTNDHRPVLSNIPPGQLNIEVTTGFTASAAGVCIYRLSDGTNTYQNQTLVAASGGATPVLKFSIPYTSAQSSITLKLQAADNQASGCTADNSAAGTYMSWKIYYFPSSSQTVVNMDSSSWYVDATMDGANPSLGVAAVSSYTEIAHGSLTLTPQSGSSAVGVMCSGTNAATAPSSSATTCAAGNESVGINFTIPKAGVYQVCWSGSHYTQVNSGVAIEAAFQLIETPTNAQTLTLEGGTRQASQFGGMTIASGTGAQSSHPIDNCSLFNWTSVGTKGVRLMYEQAVTGTPSNSLILGDASTSVGQRNMRWTVRPWTQNQPMPLLVGGVTANATVQSGGANGLTTVDYGTASVTVANISNTASITSPATCNYMRVGSAVNVACPITHGCTTAAGTDSTFYVTLPITSDIQNAYDLSGTYGTGNASETGRIYADSTNNRAEVNFRCQATGAGLHTVIFQYIVR